MRSSTHGRIRHLQSGKARKWVWKVSGFNIRSGCVHWFNQERKKEGEKKRKKVKSTKQREQEDRMKTEREKERKKSWDQVFKNKRKYCVGTEPSAILYIGILHSSNFYHHWS